MGNCLASLFKQAQNAPLLEQTNKESSIFQSSGLTYQGVMSASSWSRWVWGWETARSTGWRLPTAAGWSPHSAGHTQKHKFGVRYSVQTVCLRQVILDGHSRGTNSLLHKLFAVRPCLNENPPKKVLLSNYLVDLLEWAGLSEWLEPLRKTCCRSLFSEDEFHWRGVLVRTGHSVFFSCKVIISLSKSWLHW